LPFSGSRGEIRNMSAALSAAATLTEADGRGLVIRCHCDRSVDYPCRLLGRRYGPGITVGEAAARLRCRKCQTRPRLVELVDRPQLDAPGFVSNAKAVRIRIIGDAAPGA
jgi:hypothetical protein